MKRIYEKVTTEFLSKKHNEIVDYILKELPKSKHRCFYELLEIERELSLREG